MHAVIQVGSMHKRNDQRTQGGRDGKEFGTPRFDRGLDPSDVAGAEVFLRKF